MFFSDILNKTRNAYIAKHTLDLDAIIELNPHILSLLSSLVFLATVIIILLLVLIIKDICFETRPQRHITQNQ